MRTLLLVTIVCLLSIAPCAAATFTLDPTSQCTGIGEAHNVALTAGTHYVDWLSGSWSPVANDADYGGYAWTAHVKVYLYATDETLTIGDVSQPGYYTSAELAEAAALGLYPIYVSTNTVAAFYIEDIGGCENNRGAVTLGIDQLTPVGDHPVARTELLANVPNPFNPATAVRFTLAERGHVRIDVYDVAGKFVANLVDEERPAGLQQVGWNGVDANNRRMASGVYLVRMSARDEHFTRKIVLLK
jgi:hypothetical protein